MAVRRGYRSYRGRRSGGKTALTIVLALALVLAALYLVLQNFIIYESDGSMRVDLPFFRQEDGAGDGADDGEIPPVEILPGEAPEDAAAPVNAQEVSAAALCGDEEAAFRALREAGRTGFVVEMKGDNGFFRYTSDLARPNATAEDAVSQTRMSAALAAAEEAELTAAARIYCFHDSFFAFSDMAGAGICQSSGYIWYDEQSSYWLEPSKAAARDYLCAVASECVDMGFRALLLSGFTYPTAGDQDQIDYSHMTESKADALCGFLTQLRQTVGEEIPIAVELPEAAVLSGADETAGLDLGRLLPLVDRICVSAEDPEAVLAAAREAGARPDQVVFLTDGVYTSASAES